MNEIADSLEMVRAAGGTSLNVHSTEGGDYITFTDPQSGSSMGMWAHEIRDAASVAALMQRYRDGYAEARFEQMHLQYLDQRAQR